MQLDPKLVRFLPLRKEVEEWHVSNYCLVRLDRNRHCDGILLYMGMICHTMLLLWVLKTFSCLELLCTMVTIALFCLCTLYSPPDTTNLVLQQLFVLLQNLSPSLYSNFVIIGDLSITYSCLPRGPFNTS